MNYLTRQNLRLKMNEACIKGDLPMIQKLLSERTDKFMYDMNLCANTVYINGQVDAIKWFNINSNCIIDYINGVHTMCKICTLDTVKKVINLTPPTSTNDEVFKFCSLAGACCKGDKDMVIYLMNRGSIHHLKYKDLVYYAAYGGNLDIVLLLIQHIKNINKNINERNISFNSCMYGACLGGHEHIIKFAIENKAGVNCWNEGMRCACYMGHLGAVKLMIQHGANNWNDCLVRSGGKNLELSKLLIDCGADCWDRALTEPYSAMTDTDKTTPNATELFKFIELMIQHGATDINGGLLMGCYAENIQIVELMIKLGATDFDEALAICCGKNNINLTLLMVRKGAKRLNQLECKDEFKLACYYCIYKEEDPKQNTRCQQLLRTYPVFVLLCSKINPNLHSKPKLLQRYKWVNNFYYSFMKKEEEGNEEKKIKRRKII